MLPFQPPQCDEGWVGGLAGWVGGVWPGGWGVWLGGWGVWPGRWGGSGLSMAVVGTDLCLCDWLTLFDQLKTAPAELAAEVTGSLAAT